MTERIRRFRVALSFPGEKRDFVRQVADALAATVGRPHVLYDDFLTAELARPDMDVFLGELYREESDLLVPFYSVEYERKTWCKLEWRQMRDILQSMESHRIMPLRFDNTPIAGVLSIDGYVDISRRAPSEVAELILERLGNPVESNRPRPYVARPAPAKDAGERTQRLPQRWPVWAFSRVNELTARRQLKVAVAWFIPPIVAALLLWLATGNSTLGPLATKIEAAWPTLTQVLYFAGASTFLYLLILSKQANSQIVLSAAQCLSFLAALYLICALMPFLPPMFFATHTVLVVIVALFGVRHVAAMPLMYSRRKDYGDATLESLVALLYLLFASFALWNILPLSGV
jgi:hypothetical protein